MKHVEGADRLVKKLERFGNMDSVIENCMRNQVQHVRGAAVNFCPADKGELRRSIHTKVAVNDHVIKGTVYTNKEYAAYVEFGTGPTGEANHAGISPKVSVSYSQKGWGYQDNDGEWHYTNGQAAQPFMYPALKSMESTVLRNMGNYMKAEIKKLV